MGQVVAQISSRSFRQSSLSLSTKNAWAQIARRMFYGQNLIKCCMREWNLTEGQARGLVYSQVTQPTIDAILKHDPMTGLALHIEVGIIVTGVKLEELFDHQAREAAHEKNEWEAAERRNTALSARAAERRAFGRTGAR